MSASEERTCSAIRAERMGHGQLVMGMIAILCFTGTLAQAEADCSLSEDKVDNGIRLVVANQYISLTIEPANGGRIVSFVDQATGEELVFPGGGLIGDKMRTPRGNDEWLARPYQFEVLENNKESVAVKLSRAGEGSLLKYLTIEKTVSIKKNSSAVQVDYRVALDSQAMVPWIIPLGFSHNPGWAKGPTKYIIPTEQGIQAVPVSSGMSMAGQTYYYNPPRGWLGTLGANRVGLAWSFDSKYVMCDYVYRGPVPIVEWMFRSRKVSAGQAIETSMAIMPIRGMRSLCGVGKGIAVEADPLSINSTRLELNLLSAVKRKVRVIAELRRLPATDVLHREKGELLLDADTPRRLSFPVSMSGPGTYVLSGQVKEVETGTYLGKISERKATIPIGYHALWMLSLEPIEKLVVQGTKSAKSGQKVSLSFELIPAQVDTKSILRVEVSGPDGRQKPWYASNVLAVDGQAEYTFRTAINDQPGRWRIHVRDIASGIQAETFFKVE